MFIETHLNFCFIIQGGFMKPNLMMTTYSREFMNAGSTTLDAMHTFHVGLPEDQK
jgi:hypothetical protein